ncbi:MAG: hypothetical protein WAW07_16185 [Bacteroidales bacterium]
MQILLRRSFTLIFAIISISYFASAQQGSLKNDSNKLYLNIESYSKRSKLNEFIYNLIFKPVTPDSKNQGVRRKTYKKLIQKPYSTFEGKIIRNIDVINLDPFGYSATDTTVSKPNFLYKAGNGMHIKTQGITIRNLLLVHRNQPFNSLTDMNSAFVPVNLKFRTQDYWGGKALQLFKGSTEDVLVTNLILAARYLHIRYLEKPPELLDLFIL